MKWGASMHRFGKKFDHGLLEASWDWWLRVEKRPPKKDFKAMTEKKWDEFDNKLKEKLLDVGKVDNMQVEISEKGLSTHFGRLSGCIQQTIKEVVPPKKRVKFDGRKASEQTRALYAERIRAFNAKRKKSITKKERKAWHKTLSKSSKRDYHDWIARWVKRIEEG